MPNFTTPGINDTQSFFEIIRFVNDSATDGLFMPIMLLTIWIIAFIGSISETSQAYKAWTFASFIGTILAILMALMGFLDAKYIYLLVFSTAGGLAWTHLMQNKLS